jgi:aminomethyltransferase
MARIAAIRAMSIVSRRAGMAGAPAIDEALRTTPLDAEHRALGARMVPFAGYSMPVQYRDGIIAEHKHTRDSAGLFDVSHMGQAFLIGPDRETTAAALEGLTPGDFRGLGLGRQRYTLLLNDAGGIVDDLMVTRPASTDDDGHLMLVVNASRKEVDYEYLRERLPANVRLEPRDDRALIALQGPKAAAVIARHAPGAAELGFMRAAATEFDGIDCHVSRSGYTGEDGFEISVPGASAVDVWRALVAEPEVRPVGLGARDSLRLEAGLCLYGHDIDETTSPVEAALNFALSKRRLTEGGFPGHARIARELASGPTRLRVGLRVLGKTPAREGTPIEDPETGRVGMVTSGGFGPTVDTPIAMGYVVRSQSAPGTPLNLIVRDRPQPATVVDMPFVPHRYVRGGPG